MLSPVIVKELERRIFMNPQKKFNLRKQELFTQITDLINTEGYENITVRGLCQKLSISTGTFYHYFPQKGDLVYALFADIDDYFLNEVTRNFTEDETSNLVTFCEHYGIYVIKNGVETCRCISAAPLKNDSPNYLDEERGIFQILEQILSRGEDKKQFYLMQSPKETTRMLMVLLRGYSADWAKREGNYDLIESLHHFILLFRISLCQEK